MPSNAPPPHYLTIQELSRTTGFSVSQLRRLVRKGVIPALQPGGKGGKLLFRPDALEACAAGMPDTSTPARRGQLSGPAPRWQTS